VINQQLETKLSTLNEYDQKILTVCDVANIEKKNRRIPTHGGKDHGIQTKNQLEVKAKVK